MLSKLFSLIVPVIVLGCIGAFLAWLPVPNPFKFVLWAIFFLVVLAVFLPFLGIHVPA